MKLIFDLIALLIVLGVITVIIIKMKSMKIDNKTEEIFPYYKKSPLTQVEQIFYHRLVKALPNHMVLAQVQYSRFIGIKKEHVYNKYIGKIDKKSIDFLILNKDASISSAIELDEKSHDTPTRKESDKYKNNIIESAGIKLHRWRTTAMPNELEIQKAIGA